MFENAGKEIKKLAIILFWVSVVATIICAFVFGWEDVHYYYGGWGKEFNPFFFFGILIGGIIFSYFSCLFMAAFGELVENSKLIKEAVEEKKNTTARSEAVREESLEEIAAELPEL